MEHIATVGGIVTGFTITEQHIDCICGKELLKIEKNSGDVIYAKEILHKEGFTRNLIADNGQIFINDFCMLYAFNQNDYQLFGKWQLGADLSSDICGMMVDKDTIYCSMRNGKMVTVNRQSFAMNEYNVTDSSMWSIKAYGKYLVCGTVDGQLLLIDKETLTIEKKLNLGKQNIGSLCSDNGELYAASQDKKIIKINMLNYEIDDIKRNAHKRMFECIGFYEDMVITISYPSCEIILWDKKTLKKRKEIKVPLKLSGRTYIENNYLYISSRNILGIDRISLDE